MHNTIRLEDTKKEDLEIELKQAYRKIQQLTNKIILLKLKNNTDALTGLYNYSKFEEKFKKFIKEGERGRKFSLCILDIDYFKKINDNYGHNVGNYILKELADILKSSTRDIDYVFRYGGEEFAMIFPETTSEGGNLVLNRIRTYIKNYKFTSNINITVSMGLTEYNTKDNWDSLIQRSDKALYEAKDLGRDRIVIL